MDGIQQTVAEALRELARKVEEGQYGRGDDFDDTEFASDLLDVELVAR